MTDQTKDIYLYHVIADSASAEVRRALVQTGLVNRVDFRNIAYETNAESLKKWVPALTVPTLVIRDEKVIIGKDDVLAWIRDNQ